MAQYRDRCIILLNGVVIGNFRMTLSLPLSPSNYGNGSTSFPKTSGLVSISETFCGICEVSKWTVYTGSQLMTFLRFRLWTRNSDKLSNSKLTAYLSRPCWFLPGGEDFKSRDVFSREVISEQIYYTDSRMNSLRKKNISFCFFSFFFTKIFYPRTCVMPGT